MRSLTAGGAGVGGSFRQLAEDFLAAPGLPFGEVLSAERIKRVFARHDNLFGGTVYSTALVLWSFLSQVLRDGKEASCQAAVARIVADRYYCSYFMIALLLQRQVDVCARLHQCRRADFRGDLRLGKNDKLVAWIKPPRPQWMDEATYATIPDELELRMVRFHIVEPGRRTRQITVITTLLDADEYSQESIAQLYGFRWNSELDIRSIKQSLNLSHVRCKSPEMVRRELWTTLLGYNLIRTTAAAAAALHDKQPRQISFTNTCQYVLAWWHMMSSGLLPPDRLESCCRQMLAHIARCQVADRPGRLEPRVLKRRRHGYPLMQLPRHTLRKQLANPK